ncbi:MAG: Rpn family recombination-promoting nuclease/putative transposase [Firmicutes bacterium]|nr:Rpn family recombination-promoting nuclease/putative transposase [Bacillota bacterium]
MNNNIIPYEKLPMSHAFMFDQVMKKPAICKLFLEELLGWDIERIEYIERQKDINDSYHAKGIRLDIYIHASNKVYNVEMQAEKEESLERRIRYYQSGLDRHELMKGMPYKELPDSFIIFICNYDPYGDGLAVYERSSILKQTNRPYDDGSHAVILNTHYKSTGSTSEAIIEFLDYIRIDDALAEPSTELVKKAKEQVHTVRHDKELGAKYMTLEVMMMNKFWKGERAGRLKVLIEKICKKYVSGKPVEIIADEIDEDLAFVEMVIRLAEEFEPEYDVDKIYEKLTEIQ